MAKKEIRGFKDERQQHLQEDLVQAINGRLLCDGLYFDEQLEPLADAVLANVNVHSSLMNASQTEYCKMFIKAFARRAGLDVDIKKHKGGRVVIPDEANSWLRVFPSPLSAEQVMRNVLIRTADGKLGYNPADVATKMQGVLLTSMPEEDKAEIKRRMKALHLLVVSKPDHSRLCYVVFGAGMQASTKTDVVRDRIAHNEIIEGVYFEDWLEVLDELEEMKEGYDMDYIAQCEALAEEEAEAQSDGSSSTDDDDDLPF